MGYKRKAQRRFFYTERVEKTASLKSHLATAALGAALGGTGAGVLGYKAYSKAKDEQKDHFLHGMETAFSNAHLPDIVEGRHAIRTPYKKGPLPMFARNTAAGVEELYPQDLGKFANAFYEGFSKRASEVGALTKKANFGHAMELAGLGILAAPASHELVDEESAHKFWTPKKKAVAEVGGLGVLALPSIRHFLTKGKK